MVRPDSLGPTSLPIDYVLHYRLRHRTTSHASSAIRKHCRHRNGKCIVRLSTPDAHQTLVEMCTAHGSKDSAHTCTLAAGEYAGHILFISIKCGHVFGWMHLFGSAGTIDALSNECTVAAVSIRHTCRVLLMTLQFFSSFFLSGLWWHRTAAGPPHKSWHIFSTTVGTNRSGCSCSVRIYFISRLWRVSVWWVRQQPIITNKSIDFYRWEKHANELVIFIIIISLLLNYYYRRCAQNVVFDFGWQRLYLFRYCLRVQRTLRIRSSCDSQIVRQNRHVPLFDLYSPNCAAASDCRSSIYSYSLPFVFIDVCRQYEVHQIV